MDTTYPKNTNSWFVFVGGIEINDYLLTHEQAEHLAEEYHAQDYDDVSVAFITGGSNNA
jgi:hypothetical protein